MMEISKWTMQREECLKKIIQEKEKALENNPEGTLRANKHGNSFQYYVMCLQVWLSRGWCM